MRIVKIGIVHTFLVGTMLMAFLLCFSSQVLATQEGDYTYTITGGKAQITKYTGSGGVVLIPSTLGEAPVTSIGTSAFAHYTFGLTSIIIPQGVTSIGNGAFYNCRDLTAVSIPESVISIGDGAFSFAGLTSFSLPQGVKNIGIDSFSDCLSLTTISIPESVTSIGAGAFSRCPDLTAIIVAANNLNYRSIDGVLYNKAGTILMACPAGLIGIIIPQEVTIIGNDAFDGCTGLTSISLPQGVTTIGDYAFSRCTGLTSINLPLGVTSIGDGAFFYCTGLTTISLPQEVTSIGDYGFYSTGLASISVPQGVANIGIFAFSDCADLATIRFNSATTTIYNRADTIPITTKILGYDPSTANDYAKKYYRDFEAIGTLQSIVITSTATKLSYLVGDELDISGLVVTGTYTDGSTKTESITTANITGFSSVTAATEQVLTITVSGKTVAYKVQILAPIVNADDIYTYTITAAKAQITAYTGSGGDVTIPSMLGGAPVTSIGSNAFNWCYDLTSISLPQGVTSIGYSAFQGCSSLTSINIPQGVTSIGNSAFSGCSSLTTMTLSQGITSIGERMFQRCDGLTSISIPQGVTKIESWAFDGCSGLTSISLPQELISIGYAAFDGCSGLSSISIPQGVTSIGTSAFQDCSALTSIGLPQELTSIGDSAFEWCQNLSSINIPQEVTSIGKKTFQNCRSLETVSIPESVTSIGIGAFDWCISLTSITVAVDNLNYKSIDGILYNQAGTILLTCPGGKTTVNIPQKVTIIGENAFIGCEGLTSISLPQGVTIIGDHAFSGCKGLKSFSIPKGVTSLGFAAFYGCEGLTSVSIAQGYIGVNIGGSAFAHCSSLTSISLPQTVSSIESYAFAYCSSLTSIALPLDIISMGDRILYSCEDLTSIIMPIEVGKIGREAFAGCEALTSVIMPQKVYSIGEDAFYGCHSLTSIRFNAAATYIYGREDTIPAEIKIIGHASSTAKDYAAKYNREFEVIGEKVDKTLLTIVITNATKLLGSKSIGVADGNVSQAVYDVYSTIITSATTVKNSPSVTQRQVDDEVRALALATTEFNSNALTAPRDIALDKEWRIRFSQPVDPSTIQSNIVLQRLQHIPLMMRKVDITPIIDPNDPNVVIIKQVTPFDAGTMYDLSVYVEIKNTSGKTLSKPSVFSFRTRE